MSLRWNLTPAGELLLVYSFQEPSCLEPVEASPPRVSAEGRSAALSRERRSAWGHGFDPLWGNQDPTRGKATKSECSD
ncbi:hypothetical protein R6Z07F_008096 [Ovis aries]